MLLFEKILFEQGRQVEARPLRSRYFTAIDSCSLKMVADSTDFLHRLRAFRNMDDLEQPEISSIGASSNLRNLWLSCTF